MLFPGFVVAEEFALENVFEEFAGDDPSGAFLGLSALGGELQCVVGGASVAVCEGGDAKKNVVRHFGRFVAAAWHGEEAARFGGEGAAKQLDDLRSGERFEDVHLGAGQKRRDDFKGGIFGGSANESDMAGFDVRKEGVLLSFVEAVNFVDEDNGAVAGGRFVFGGGHDLLDFLDAGEDGAEGDELGVRDASNEARKRGFRSEEHTSELQSRLHLVCRLLLEKKKKKYTIDVVEHTVST